MPEFDSLSFALLIPFGICFVLIFVVCCFADEIKDICRLPSPLPSSYIGSEHSHTHRARRSRERQRREANRSRTRADDSQNLILGEEGYSRHVSESSSLEYAAHQSVNTISEQPSTSGMGNNAGNTNNTCTVTIEFSSPKKDDVSPIVAPFVSRTSQANGKSNFNTNLSLGSQAHSVCQTKEPKKLNRQLSVKSEKNYNSGRSRNSPQGSDAAHTAGAAVHSSNNLTNHNRNNSLPDVLSTYLSRDDTNVNFNTVIAMPSTSIPATSKPSVSTSKPKNVESETSKKAGVHGVSKVDHS